MCESQQDRNSAVWGLLSFVPRLSHACAILRVMTLILMGVQRSSLTTNALMHVEESLWTRLGNTNLSSSTTDHVLEDQWVSLCLLSFKEECAMYELNCS